MQSTKYAPFIQFSPAQKWGFGKIWSEEVLTYLSESDIGFDVLALKGEILWVRSTSFLGELKDRFCLQSAVI